MATISELTGAPQKNHHSRTQLAALDDACLLRVFKFLEPLPDLFSVALACHRFRRLSTGDKRLWRVVAPVGFDPERTPCGRACGGPCYSTLRAAVADSKPGDTIWLSPGLPHSADELVIDRPLRLLGGGSRPEDVIIQSPSGADAALIVGATAKVANLCVHSTLGACVEHRQGCLRIERCLLQTDARGLSHLLSPLVTLAVSLKAEQAAPRSASCRSTRPGAAQTGPGQQQDQQQPPPRSRLGSGGQVRAGGSGPLPGAGRVAVVETQLLGGSAAVHCAGTGSLQGVRVIQAHAASFFWLSVDSRTPGRFAGVQRGPPAAASAGLRAARRLAAAAVGEGSAALAPVAPAAALAGVVVKQEEEQGAEEGAWVVQAPGSQGQQHACAQVAFGEDPGAGLEASCSGLPGGAGALGSGSEGGCLPATSAAPVLVHPDWPADKAGPSWGPGEPVCGLARINQVLGTRAINPAAVEAHLAQRHQRQAQRQRQG